MTRKNVTSSLFPSFFCGRCILCPSTGACANSATRTISPATRAAKLGTSPGNAPIGTAMVMTMTVTEGLSCSTPQGGSTVTCLFLPSKRHGPFSLSVFLSTLHLPKGRSLSSTCFAEGGRIQLVHKQLASDSYLG